MTFKRKCGCGRKFTTKMADRFQCAYCRPKKPRPKYTPRVHLMSYYSRGPVCGRQAPVGGQPVTMSHTEANCPSCMKMRANGFWKKVA